MHVISVSKRQPNQIHRRKLSLIRYIFQEKIELEIVMFYSYIFSDTLIIF